MRGRSACRGRTIRPRSRRHGDVGTDALVRRSRVGHRNGGHFGSPDPLGRVELWTPRRGQGAPRAGGSASAAGTGISPPPGSRASRPPSVGPDKTRRAPPDRRRSAAGCPREPSAGVRGTARFALEVDAGTTRSLTTSRSIGPPNPQTVAFRQGGRDLDLDERARAEDLGQRRGSSTATPRREGRDRDAEKPRASAARAAPAAGRAGARAAGAARSRGRHPRRAHRSPRRRGRARRRAARARAARVSGRPRRARAASQAGSGGTAAPPWRPGPRGGPCQRWGLTSAQVLLGVQAKETAFKTRKDALADLRKTTEVTIDGALTEFKALLPLTAFDAQPTDAAAEEKQIVTLAADIRIRAGLLIEDIDKRIAGVQAKLTAHDAEADPDKRIQLLTEAARLVLGDQFVLVPSFALSPKQAAEWTNAYQNRAKLLDYQKTVLHNEFAVDDWLYTTARVSTEDAPYREPHVSRRGGRHHRAGARAPCSSRTAPMLHGWRWSFRRRPRTDSLRSCCCTRPITRKTFDSLAAAMRAAARGVDGSDSGGDGDHRHHVPVRQAERGAAAGHPAGDAAAVHRRVELDRSRADAARDARHGAPARGRAAAARSEPRCRCSCRPPSSRLPGGPSRSLRIFRW